MRWRILLVVSLCLFVAVSCDQQPVEPQLNQDAGALFNAGAGIIHHASIGSGDLDIFGGPGGDANFSMVANMRADGTVTGQWHDQFAGGVGLHVAVDCLWIVDDIQAVVGGVVTKAPNPTYVGTRALMTVFDNGTSANDPPDELSLSFFGFGPDVDCEYYPPSLFRDVNAVFELTRGQVKVW